MSDKQFLILLTVLIRLFDRSRESERTLRDAYALAKSYIENIETELMIGGKARE